mmetsp:Transcript_120504/g.239852  ORF Transcript_120504/g.239852 Transcript_120504/m.239852 type:complete len:202 (-) Transcript_120504:82-687(-)
MGGPADQGGQGTDNFYEAPITMDNQTYPTCEHYYQAQKFPGTDEESQGLHERIRNEPNVGKVYGLGQGSVHLLRPDWEHVKAFVMYTAVRAKYEQHPEILQELLATRGKIVAAPSTSNWQSLNGMILERVREEFRPGGPLISERRMRALVKLTSEYTADAHGGRGVAKGVGITVCDTTTCDNSSSLTRSEGEGSVRRSCSV